MKNTIKMSLAAAVAVSAFSTSAFAGNLEEMIKGVSASGKINVEYQNDSNDKGMNAQNNSTNQTEYDIDMTFKVPVNDMITATIGFQADHDTDIEAVNSSRTGVADDVDVTQVNFTYANGPLTVIAGKQNVGTPFLYDQKGDGVVALYNAGPVTLAAAHFVNTNVSMDQGNNTILGTLPQGAEDINAVAAIGSVAGINMSAWYVTTTLATGTEADAYTLDVNGKIADMVTFDVRHSAAEVDATGLNFDEETLTKVVLGADVGSVALTLGYGTTNDVLGAGTAQNLLGARVHGVSWDDDDTTETGFNGEQAYLDTLNDADAILVGASTSFDKFAVGITYIDGSADQNGAAAGDLDFDELILNASYAMSKNFTISSYYSMYEVDFSNTANDVENDEFSLALTYKF